MEVSCFATLKHSLKCSGLFFFFNPNVYAAQKWVSMCGAALHNMCSKRGNILACNGKWVKLSGINVLLQSVFGMHTIQKVVKVNVHERNSKTAHPMEIC